LILQQGPLSPPGLFAEWAESRGLPTEVRHTYQNGATTTPELDGRPFVCCLGCRHSPLDRDEPVVAETTAIVRGAVAQKIPVLGLCYGGQVLADVLGGQIETAPEPELGWYSIESDDPDVVPTGPWLEWHYQSFTVPPGARELARSGAGAQAFISGPHLGTQFHPESTIEIVQGWANRDRERLERNGFPDAGERLESGRAQAPLARANAFQLFDVFWERAQRAERRDP
jgi:GMP synthase-like glutamine amidotransferase